ncbi:hypothetical protein RMSM_07436 [Rhodopirellula maiorica SM1]|uniref:DUF4332 domain-containing protein n=1 Tax=Rhodopirellula maiorica SM1 TaxID=1265738 RepID=M5R895_9BACT|nr:DUF4332 domain-containing protein [Rhodopirellula maiorica]EMI15610.1 hypothetical protein RMSM_07436 [Rhodopirellula maiorica SM1]
MLKTLFKLLSRTPQQPVPVDPQSQKNAALFAYLQQPPPPLNHTPTSKPAMVAAHPVPKASHRERLLSMRIEHLQICSESRANQFSEFGVDTAGDLISANLRTLAEKYPSPRKAVRVLKRYRQAIRLAARVPGMMPRDALLLISIHRRSVRGLAMETPMSLYRDLQRYAESTPGRKQLRGRRLPSVKRIRRWITVSASELSVTGNIYADAA